MQSAHGFDYNANLRVRFNDGKILDKPVAQRAVREVPKIQNIFDLNLFFCPFGNIIGVAAQHFRYTGTYYAMPHNRYFYHMPFPPFLIPEKPC